MEKKKIAKVLADIVYRPCNTDEEKAICFLIQKTCIPNNVKWYDDDEAYEYILTKLNSIKDEEI